MKYKKILVTGAAGFIGFHLCKTLLEKGYSVVGLDNINDYYSVGLKYARLKELGLDTSEVMRWAKESKSVIYPEYRFIRLNIEDRVALPSLFEREKFNAVINLAAQAGVRYSLENPMAYVDSNIVGFVNVMECCRYNNVEHLVYASSSSVYGKNAKIPFSEKDRVDNPVSLYAATKKANELLAYTYSHLYRLATSGLRFFTVYGPWGRPDMAPMLFASAIAEKRTINVFNNGEMSRDFTYIDDIVQGILITLENPPESQEETAPYRIYNIGNGSPVSLLDFIKLLEEHLGQVDKNMLPMQPGDVPRTWADTTRLNSLGYNSMTPIDEGVKRFVEWFLGHNHD